MTARLSTFRPRRRSSAVRAREPVRGAQQSASRTWRRSPASAATSSSATASSSVSTARATKRAKHRSRFKASRTCWRNSACSCRTTSTRSCATSRPSPCRRRCRRSRSPARRSTSRCRRSATRRACAAAALLMTPLRGADGEIYALAQGNLIVGGFGVQGDDGSRVTVNVPSTGRVPNGATVERMVPTTLGTTESLVLNLNSPDFTTAARLTESINASLGAGTAESIDGISIRVRAPEGESERVAYLSHIENLEVEPAAARGQGHRQLAHGNRRHRLQRAGVAGRRRARLAGRPHHGNGAREPAERVRRRPHGRRGPVGHRRRRREQPHVRVRARHELERHRRGREPGRRGARRPRGDPRSACAKRALCAPSSS